MPTAAIGLKDILQNPKAVCVQRWPDADENDPRYRETLALVESMATLSPLLKQKKIEKQECARDFGRAKSAGANLDPLKARMNAIAKELAALEQQHRNLETTLLALFSPPVAAPRQFPERFDTYNTPCCEAIHIEQIDDGAQAAWDAYVESHPRASPYHRYQWRGVVATSFKHESFYLVARDQHGHIRGLLPLIRLRSRLFGDFAISMPFFNYGGPLADNADITELLLESAAKIAATHKLQHLEVRATQVLNNWPRRTDKVSMIRRLPASGDQLDEEIGAKVRAQIKRARQESVQIQIGNLDLLDDFYQVFAINMRDLGTPVYGKCFFRNTLATFPQQAHIVVVRLNKKPVAAAFLLGYRDMMEIPWASTLRSVNALNINMLLYREVLGFCIEKGYSFFDFGRSTAESGTFRFKKQWGAEALQHHWHYWLPGGGELPALKPDSPKFRLLVALWKQLPVWISKLIGPPIVKNLP